MSSGRLDQQTCRTLHDMMEIIDADTITSGLISKHILTVPAGSSFQKLLASLNYAFYQQFLQ